MAFVALRPGEVAFGNQNRRSAVYLFFSDTALATCRTRVFQRALGFDRRVALVDGFNRQPEARQTAYESLDRFLHVAWRTVGMRGHTDDELGWLPLADQRFEARLVQTFGSIFNDAQRAG